MTTFGIMQDRIASELGDPGGTRWQAEIKQHIVDAVAFYQSRKFWFTQDRAVQASDVTSATVAGTEYYSTPTSPELVTLDSLRILANANTPEQLERARWDSIEEWAAPGAVSGGVPVAYAVRGGQVRLYPIPDGVYTLYWAGVFKPTEIGIASGTSATNAWMTHGAALIRARAKLTMARDVLYDGAKGAIALVAEQEALDNLTAETMRRLKTGRIRAVGPGVRRSRR